MLWIKIGQGIKAHKAGRTLLISVEDELKHSGLRAIKKYISDQKNNGRYTSVELRSWLLAHEGKLSDSALSLQRRYYAKCTVERAVMVDKVGTGAIQLLSKVTAFLKNRKWITKLQWMRQYKWIDAAVGEFPTEEIHIPDYQHVGVCIIAL